MGITNEPWPENRVNQLKELLANHNLSYADIGNIMGVGVSVIAGQVNRRKLASVERTANQGHYKRGRPPKEESPFVPARKQNAELQRVKFEAKKFLPKVEGPISKPTPLLKVSNTQCKFPLWPDAESGGPDFLVCGAPAHRYCEFHSRVMGH